MEVFAEEAGLTRQSRRERTLTTKAMEQERMKHGGKSGDGISIATLTQTSNESREWKESDEYETEGAIEVRVETPDAPRPSRILRRPKTPSRPTVRSDTGAKMTKSDPLSTILAAIEDLKSSNAELKAANAELRTGTRELMKELAEVKTQLVETQTQLAEIMSPSNWSGSGKSTGGLSPQLQSYASVLTRPINPSSSASQPGARTVSSAMTDTLYCTVDTSRIREEDRSEAQPGTIRQAIEKEMRTTEGRANWRCAAVIRDARNANRVRIACRDEAELQKVKQVIEKVAVTGTRVLRDQLYPVKVDNANRTAILDTDGNILPGAAEVLGKENEVDIAKISWLSKKDTHKAYGSMLVYVTKMSHARRLLEGQYFDIAGESAYTRVFEPRIGPNQCYNCQELGHKAFSCKKPQTCAKCAKEGHHHSSCQTAVFKCIPCGGTHESFSRNCRVLYPPTDA